MSGKVLDGIKVLEYGDFVSIPYCGRLLAGLGAEVVKIEKPGGDSSRAYGPFPGNDINPEKSGLFLFLNAGKSGITLDTGTAEGQDIFRRLVEKADVLIEGNPPSEMEKQGINYENLNKVKPSLVMTSVTPFGQTGPYRDYRANDLITSHISGEAYGNPAEGAEDEQTQGPLKGPNHAADFMVGLTAGVCTMSAIFALRMTGQGQYIDLSAQEAISSCVRQELAFYMLEGRAPTRQKGIKRRGGMLYRASDGFVCIWLGPHFNKLMKMMGDPDWAQTELFQDPVLRIDHIEELNTLINVWTMERPRAEIERLGAEYDVPIAPVRSVDELVSDEQLAYRNYFVDIDHPVAGKLNYPGAPFKLTETPWVVDTPAPLLGVDTERILGEWLGLSAAEQENLKQAGAI